LYSNGTIVEGTFRPKKSLFLAILLNTSVVFEEYGYWFQRSGSSTNSSIKKWSGTSILATPISVGRFAIFSE